MHAVTFDELPVGRIDGEPGNILVRCERREHFARRERVVEGHHGAQLRLDEPRIQQRLAAQVFGRIALAEQRDGHDDHGDRDQRDADEAQREFRAEGSRSATHLRLPAATRAAAM